MVSQAKYKELFHKLRSDILSGAFDASDRFPSEGQLMRKFAVSRNTIRAALEELKRNGMIETRNGSGTYLSIAARQASGAIGLIVPGIVTGEIFPQICAEIMRLARSEGYSTLFGDASSHDPTILTTQVLQLAHDYAKCNVAGVILEPMELTTDSIQTTNDVIAVLSEKKIPIVLLDRDIVRPPERSGYDLVGIDNVRAGYILARHLIECNAKRIHVLSLPHSASTLAKRIQGVREAMLDAGLVWRKSYAHEFDPDDADLVRQAFRGTADAVICGNDYTATRLIGTFHKLKIRVPNDIMVAGVDDVRYATIVSPQLTTMRQPCEQIGAAAFRTLIERIRHPDGPARETLLNAELVVRGSTQPPKAKSA